MSKLGILSAERCALLVCDLQERFADSIRHFPTVVSNAERMLKTARILDLRVLATEQYPKGLGPTVPQLRTLLKPESEVTEKTRFTMLVPELVGRLESLRSEHGVDTVLLVGIEAHVCVLATAQDLVERGFAVHVVVDAVSSRTQTDRHFALERMRGIGAFLNTTESAILSLVGDAKHPRFKEVQAVIKTLNPSTGLVKEDGEDVQKSSL